MCASSKRHRGRGGGTEELASIDACELLTLFPPYGNKAIFYSCRTKAILNGALHTSHKWFCCKALNLRLELTFCSPPYAIPLFGVAFELAVFPRGKGENHRMSYGKSKESIYKPIKLVLAGNFRAAN